jgi:mRNA-degrading endonuclease RelE of RelBE toxin-antitoxin system
MFPVKAVTLRLLLLGGEMRGAWRIRVGDYRVLYDIDDQGLVIVLAVLHRREAYR